MTMMTGKEKLYFLLNRIDDARIITPSGQPVLVHPTGNLSNNYTIVELSQLFTKLEKDEKVLKILKEASSDYMVLNLDPYRAFEDGCYHLEVLPRFDEYFAKIQLEPEYQEFTGKKPPVKQTQPNASRIESLYEKIAEVDEQIRIRREAWAKAQSTINDNPFYAEATRTGHLAKLEQQAQTDIGNFIKQKETYLTELNFRKADTQTLKSQQTQPSEAEDKSTTESVYEITYTGSREILLNKIFQIAKPDFDSENDLVFDFLYQHPNKKYTLKEIEEGIGNKLGKTLHKIVENLGFKGELRKIFIDVSGTSICFKNPVTKDDLEKIGITRIKLS